MTCASAVHFWHPHLHPHQGCSLLQTDANQQGLHTAAIPDIKHWTNSLEWQHLMTYQSGRVALELHPALRCAAELA